MYCLKVSRAVDDDDDDDDAIVEDSDDDEVVLYGLVIDILRPEVVDTPVTATSLAEEFITTFAFVDGLETSNALSCSSSADDAGGGGFTVMDRDPVSLLLTTCIPLPPVTVRSEDIQIPGRPPPLCCLSPIIDMGGDDEE